ncbi:MAG: hypothetical protein AAF675_21275 [Pseudomonadota bacterium]
MLRSSLLVLALLATPALAQQQQAGNEASTNTEETFQALIDQCDDTDALMLRARIRLQLPRTTPEAAEQAQTMLDEAFATCGGGDLEGAKAQLTEALEIASAGVDNTFGARETETATETAATESVEAETVQADATPDAAEVEAPAAEEEPEKPWWQFW